MKIIGVEGTFDEKFEPLVRLFADQGFREKGGSSLAVFQFGKPVVNVWQGEQGTGKAWSEDTTSVIFSCTKGLTSILAHQLVLEGKLNLDEKVSHYWPEFAQTGKQDIPVKWLLQHKAGLSAVRRSLTFQELTDGHTVEEELAKQAPLWEPGTAHGYHAVTFGTLIGKLIKVVTGKSAGQYFSETIAQPLSAKAWIGIPEQEFQNVAPLITDGTRADVNAAPGTNEYWLTRAMWFGGALNYQTESKVTGFNNPKLLMSELPGAGGVSNAYSLAKIYSATVFETNGLRLLSDPVIDAAIVPQSMGPLVFESPDGPFPVWGNGFMVEVPGYKEMLGQGSFGHDGFGGQMAFATKQKRMSFAYTTNYLKSGKAEQARQQQLVMKLKELVS